MEKHVEQALRDDRVVDITTTGRKSGQPRRIEIWLHYFGEGVGYLTGSPGSRDWNANLLANPRFTVHVKRGAQADLDAEASPVRDPQERRRVLAQIYGENDRNEERVAGSPLLRVELKD